LELAIPEREKEREREKALSPALLAKTQVLWLA
jgi:hypothetical protein